MSTKFPAKVEMGYRIGVGVKTSTDTTHTESRVKFLRLALQEAVRAGDKLAAKRLTARLAKLLGAA